MQLTYFLSCLNGLVLASSGGSTAEDYNAIQNTISTYSLAIDSKDFTRLSQVFTPDIVANYSAPLNVIRGLSQVQAVLQQSLAPVTTQHALSTQVMDIHDDAANSTTYMTASHFGSGLYEGQAPTWRVKARNLEYMGPFIGNASVFLSPGMWEPVGGAVSEQMSVAVRGMPSGPDAG
ncbi:hypothetical protein B0A48_05981 [Cryoendolithus antarcticus]|uniref:SnoaL-like domain-containing protein n=1 Tax=Cryoendolithus antarcticus TaxID=1507870 RepID=A0A1V8TCI9_9PEZI|nr:hypothetical protein B0A48_05981 [Cryoendolithus antarcticus]